MTTEVFLAGKDLAARCADAYSADRYRSWFGVARALLALGLTERQAEAVMRSKWARWAADGHTARYGSVPTRALVDYVKRNRDEVALLTAETFGLD